MKVKSDRKRNTSHEKINVCVSLQTKCIRQGMIITSFKMCIVNHLCILSLLGRLVDPTRTTDCGYESGDHLCISVDSWWAGMFIY